MKKIVINSVIVLFSLMILGSIFSSLEIRKKAHYTHVEICTQQNVMDNYDFSETCKLLLKLQQKVKLWHNIEIIFLVLVELLLWRYLVKEFLHRGKNSKNNQTDHQKAV